MTKEQINRIIELMNEGKGRITIARELGLTEKPVRNVMEKYRAGVYEHKDLEKLPYKISVNGNTTEVETIIKTDKKLLTKEEALKLCELDPNEWECIYFTFAKWQGMAKIDEAIKTQDLYSIRLKAEPKKKGLNLEELIKGLDNLKPHTINQIESKSDGRLIEIFLTDMHFGLNQDYTGLLDEVLPLTDKSEEVVILIGSDGLHVDNVNNTTLKGTQLEKVDINKAWEEYFTFYYNIILYCLTRGKRTVVKYIKGNHDATVSFTVIKALEKVLPTARYDTSMDNFKAHRFGSVAIGWTHGDKGRQKELDRLYNKRFPEIFNGAKTKEIHYGHQHQESVTDTYGTLLRMLPTGTVASEFTTGNGYESAARFQIFEYDKTGLKKIHYVGEI